MRDCLLKQSQGNDDDYYYSNKYKCHVWDVVCANANTTTRIKERERETSKMACKA